MKTKHSHKITNSKRVAKSHKKNSTQNKQKLPILS